MGNDERVHNVVEVDRTIANDLIKSYGAHYSIEKIERFTGGKSTSNYKIKIEGQDIYLVLKIYPQNNTVCEKEFAIYNKICDYIPVPKIYYINTEKTIINRNYCIMRCQGPVLR